MKIGRHGYPRLVRSMGAVIRVRSWEEHRAALEREDRALRAVIVGAAAGGLLALALLIAIAWNLAGTL